MSYKVSTKRFWIYFEDLNEETQKNLLKFVRAESAADMNWDLRILPIACYEIEDDEDILNLEPSVRLYNCLRRGGCDTVCDVMEKSVDELIKIRNMGRVTFVELCKLLLEHGYTRFGDGQSIQEVRDGIKL